MHLVKIEDINSHYVKLHSEFFIILMLVDEWFCGGSFVDSIRDKMGAIGVFASVSIDTVVAYRRACFASDA